MKIKTKFFVFLWLWWIISIPLQAQEVVTTSGGYGISAGSKVTWTIGEPVTETVTGTNAILTQGFNQGDLLITMIKNRENAGLILKVYPNPAQDQLSISTGDSEIDNLRYVIIDMSGKILTRKTLTGNKTDISLSGLTPSTYLLKVYQKQKEIGVYKIIKK